MLTECPHYKKVPESPAANREEAGHLVFPWTGNSLGQVALEFVAARSPTKLIGLLGPANAGKTTFLIVLYLLLSRGNRPKGRTFAGSFTLQGWENLASDFRTGSWNHPRFPPHTSAGAGRHPGLLHLALRKETERLEDVVLTDAPGEWFSTWADTQNAPAAEGARWIADHSYAFLLFADNEALSGPDRGIAIARLRRLVDRIGQHAAGRRVAVIWSKSDQQVAPETRARLRTTFDKAFPEYREFSMSALATNRTDLPPLEEFLRAFEWLLQERTPDGVPIPNLGATAVDPFYRYRGS